MGLDQHAHLRGSKVDWEKYYNEEDYGDKNNIFVWRKHARLQEFMAKKWADQNPSVKVEGHLAHLGFNGDQEAPCYMTQDVVDELGNKYQIWIDEPKSDGSVEVHAWDYKKKRKDFMTTTLDLMSALEAAYLQVSSWIDDT